MDNNYILVLTVQKCGEEKDSLVMASLDVNKLIKKLNYYIADKEKFFLDVWDEIDYGYDINDIDNWEFVEATEMPDARANTILGIKAAFDYEMKLYAFPISNDDPRHIDFEASGKFAKEIKAEILW